MVRQSFQFLLWTEVYWYLKVRSHTQLLWKKKDVILSLVLPKQSIFWNSFYYSICSQG